MRIRKGADLAPLRAHGGGRLPGDLAPFGSAVDYEDDVADFCDLQGRAGDAGLFGQVANFDQARKVEASANAAEFPDLAGKLLLGFDPVRVGRGRQLCDAVLA